MSPSPVRSRPSAPCFTSPHQRGARRLALLWKGVCQSRIRVSVQASSQCRGSKGRSPNAQVVWLVWLGPRSRRWRPFSSWRQPCSPRWSSGRDAGRRRSRAGRGRRAAGVGADHGNPGRRQPIRSPGRRALHHRSLRLPGDTRHGQRAAAPERFGAAGSRLTAENVAALRLTR
jgi:hypothetical protein